MTCALTYTRTTSPLSYYCRCGYRPQPNGFDNLRTQADLIRAHIWAMEYQSWPSIPFAWEFE